ncbi:uncharacterized protein LOC124156240 isoform X3 [Ischnura elegans]|uniref:uncharacterized protein LOC124156240 isoform X3 n=1 Tax=Ischnura elegans TaxID=197161 RepID=UPI001ED8712E|nr:uncharacterized protein LOC124156240 isoform X3 [Ischnura elegans]
MKGKENSMEDSKCLLPNLAHIKVAFPNFKFTEQRKNEPLHVWLQRMANCSKDKPEWGFELVDGEWRCTFYMKEVLIASCVANKKKIAKNKATELALRNLGVVCSGREVDGKEANGKKTNGNGANGEAVLGKVANETAESKGLLKQEEKVPHEEKGKEARDEISASSLEQNILDIQRRILSNQLRICDSVKRIVESSGTYFSHSSPEDPNLSYYNSHVVRVENSIIMKQNIILESVGSFSFSQNSKHGCEFQRFKEHCMRMSVQNEIFGNIKKCDLKKLNIVEEKLYLGDVWEELNRREPLAVNTRMVGERWNRIMENQTSMLDNQLGIMYTLSGTTPDMETGFDSLNADNHACFLANVTTTYRYKIFFHENEISSMLNDVMSSHSNIIHLQRKIFENEDKILKAFNSCIFSRDAVYEMTGRVPFLDNQLYALQLRTWAGMNHLLAKLNQVYMDRIDNLSGNDDIVNYQSEILANQKNILANLSRFPGTLSALQGNQRLILDVQNEILSHYIPAINDNQPLGEDNIGFQLLKSQGWTGGGLGSNQQGIAEPVRAEGSVGRTGLGYKNPRKRPASVMGTKLHLENLRSKLMKSKECSYIPLVGTLPALIAFNPSSETEERRDFPTCHSPMDLLEAKLHNHQADHLEVDSTETLTMG